MKPATVAEIIARIEALAPPCLAEEWDNVGLQVGRRERPVSRLRVALDPSPAVVQGACADGIDLLVTHHPLIFRPVRQIDYATPFGRSLQLAARHDLAVYCAHTNLDAAAGGVNDVLADRLGLLDLKALVPARPAEGRLKLVFFAPLASQEVLLATLADSAAGRIGAYGGCTFRVKGKGTFRPDSGAHPAIGQPGVFTQVDECRIETVVARGDLPDVLSRLRSVHPYEEMAFDLYPLASEPGTATGLGRVGCLARPLPLKRFAQQAKTRLNLRSLRLAGSPALSVRRVALCSGSGAGLLEAFLASDADCFLAGDLRYHDARAIEEAGRGLLDVGHFASEHPVVASLAERLQQVLCADRFQVQVEACGMEQDPFVAL